MQPAGVGQWDDAFVLDMQPDRQLVGLKRIFDAEREGERILRARFLRIVEAQHDAILFLLLNDEIAMARKAVQAERIGFAANARLSVARPTHDGKQDRRGVRPERRIGRPDHLAAGRQPSTQFRAAQRDARARVAIRQGNLAPRCAVIGHFCEFLH